MAARAPRARLLGGGRLPRWRPFLTSVGFLSIATDPRASVHGVLWDVPAGDMTALDRYEDVARGLYVKQLMPILRAPVGAAQALVYVGADQRRGAAPPQYLGAIVAAARAHALPAAYVDYLSQLAAPAMIGGAPPRLHPTQRGDR